MQPLTDDAKDRLKRSHTSVVKAEVLTGGQVQRELTVVDGEVVADRTADVLRRCNVTLADPDLAPAAISSLLAPNGNELKLYRGVRLADGTDELVPLGVFAISSVSTDDTPDGFTVTIDGYDRARRVRRARFTDTYVIAAGTNYADAVHDLIDSRVPGLTYSFLTTTETTPLLVFDTDDDPWQAAQDMARAIGARLYFGPSGVCRLEPEPDPATAPVVWTYDDELDAALLRVGRTLDDTKTYNHVIVSGEASGNTAPVRAEAEDTDPNSATYVDGPYGRVTTLLKSKLVSTTGQAQAVADALLRRAKGLVEQVELETVPNPALEPADVITVNRQRSQLPYTRFTVEGLTVPLSPDRAASIRARARRL